MIIWDNFNAARIDDMLRIYPEKEVQSAIIAIGESYDRNGALKTLTDYEIQMHRRLGEARAWLVHDSYFMWDGRLSNTFDELVHFLRGREPTPSSRRISNWDDLYAAAMRQTMYWLTDRFQPDWPPMPELLCEEDRVEWWRRVALVSECRSQLETRGLKKFQNRLTPNEQI